MIGGHGEASKGGRGGHDPAPLRELEHPRYELVPIKGAREQVAHLPDGAEVSVTCSPTLGIRNTLGLAEDLLGQGFSVVPHLVARLVQGEAHLEGCCVGWNGAACATSSSSGATRRLPPGRSRAASSC